MRHATLIVVLVALGFSTPALPRSWYINPDGTGDAPDISTGISYCSSGDTLLLADGVYSGSGNTGLAYGGKAIVIRSQSGDPHACVIDCGDGRTEHVRGFTFNQRERSRSVLEGVTIRNGHANEGAGIYCWATSPTISNVILSGNVALHAGGGLYCGRGAAPVLTNVTLVDNSASFGGGIYCTYYAAPVVQQSIVAFSRNGGAVVLGGDGNIPVFTCCDIYGNTGGDWQGGVSNQYGQSGNISSDPLFCLEANPEKPYCLHSDSPCISGPESTCGLMGAAGIGCTSGMEAIVDIKPDVLNPRSRRRWLTCYVELPGGHDPHTIDVSTVVLNGEVYAATRPTTVGDYDADGIPDRMVKFPWSEVLASLDSFGMVEMEVSGSADGNAFSAGDTVLVHSKNAKSKSIPPWVGLEAPGHISVSNPSQTGRGVGIRLDISDVTHVNLQIYDVRGKMIRTLVDAVRDPDIYMIHWDGKDRYRATVAPGIYFAVFEADRYRAISKVVVAR
jgi:hypothetical protein